MAIVKERIALIDNAINRKIVSDNLMSKFEDSIKNEEVYIREYLKTCLNSRLSKLDLYDLLRVDANDCPTIVWNMLYDIIKKNVCEKIFCAKAFFAIGEDASLNGDKYWDEYNHVIHILLPDTAGEFAKMILNDVAYDNKVEEVSAYISSVANTKCKWVGYSYDGSYHEVSKNSFDNVEDCYNDMRDAVLSKMKWNTNVGEELNDVDDVVEYKVIFTKEMIAHSSYSSCYVYKIVSEDENPTKEEIFTEEMVKSMRGYKMYEI